MEMWDGAGMLSPLLTQNAHADRGAVSHFGNASWSFRRDPQSLGVCRSSALRHLRGGYGCLYASCPPFTRRRACAPETTGTAPSRQRAPCPHVGRTEGTRPAPCRMARGTPPPVSLVGPRARLGHRPRLDTCNRDFDRSRLGSALAESHGSSGLRRPPFGVPLPPSRLVWRHALSSCSRRGCLMPSWCFGQLEPATTVRGGPIGTSVGRS
jgi:hypothetical protein